MKLGWFISGVLLACSVSLHAEDWKPLFEKDLSNATCNREVWTVDEEGVLTACRDEAVWSAKGYENFELSLEFKTDNGTNSGVVIYCSDRENWIPNSIEIQISDDSAAIANGSAPTRHQCGAIYGHVAPAKLLVKKPGEWNQMSVKCEGTKIAVALNGEKVSEMEMSLWTSAEKNPDGSEIPSWLSKPKAEIAPNGYIGFQGKHGQSNIYFRNIRVRSL